MTFTLHLKPQAAAPGVRQKMSEYGFLPASPTFAGAGLSEGLPPPKRLLSTLAML
jgi:hypothetical protein